MPKGKARRTPPDTFRKAAGEGYWDLYRYLPGWKNVPQAQRRSVLLGRVQIVGLNQHRFFPVDGAWPRDVKNAYTGGVAWLCELFEADHPPESWEALSVVVHAGAPVGRRVGVTAPAPIKVGEIKGLGAAEFRRMRARLAREEKLREAAEARAAETEKRKSAARKRKREESPKKKADDLYREFRKAVSKSHDLYHRVLPLRVTTLDVGQDLMLRSWHVPATRHPH